MSSLRVNASLNERPHILIFHPCFSEGPGVPPVGICAIDKNLIDLGRDFISRVPFVPDTRLTMDLRNTLCDDARNASSKLSRTDLVQALTSVPERDPHMQRRQAAEFAQLLRLLDHVSLPLFERPEP